MADTLSGSCLCGAIRYTVSQPITELRVCHCTNCQKTSGTGGSVNAPIPASAFKLTQGTLKRYAGKADSGRTLYRFFCGDCGAPIYSQRETTPETIALRIGTIDSPPPMQITAHIWTKSKRPWSHIESGAKQFEGQP